MKARFFLQSLAIASLLAGIAACGVSIDKEKGVSSKSAGAKLSLKWPAGYRYDTATHRLAPPASPVGREAPIYVTSVTLSVTGAGIEPMSLDVPLDTLEVDVTLVLGEYTFDVRVDTDSGDTFTGTETMLVSPFESPVVEIALEINAPPKIIGIDVSNPNPLPGETITMTGYAEDPDPDDVLTYGWYAYGPIGIISGSGQSFTGDVPLEGGLFTITLVVEDGHGGTAYAERIIHVPGTPPVIVDTTVSNTTPKVGDIVTLYGNATDADPGDQLAYHWAVAIPKGGTARLEGQSVDFKISNAGLHVATLTVADLQGNKATSSVRFDAACNYATPKAPTITNVTAGTGQPIVITYTYPGAAAGETTDGIAVYNLDWSQSANSSGASPTNGWKGGYSKTGTISFTCTTGSFYSFKMSAGNSCQVAGPLSAANPLSPALWLQCM
jgi:hypothetical protein